MERLKMQGRQLLEFLNRHKNVILLALPLILMDLCIRSLASHVTFYPLYYPVSNMFTLAWVILFVGVSASLRGIWGRFFYWVCFIPFWILYIVHSIYYGMTEFYFSFNLMQMASEGSGYIWDAIAGAGWWIWVSAGCFLAMAFFAVMKLPRTAHVRWKRLGLVVLAFLLVRVLALICLGRPATELEWSTFKNPRHVYDDFSDMNKSMRVSGLYEYTVRNLFKTVDREENVEDEDDLGYLESVYSAGNTHAANDYTGLFAGKNVIFLQLEGMDTWLLTPEGTPNLYALQQQSINFTEHYSIYTGGGSTFNSEFAVNTGFTTPISYVENVYSYHKNCFDQSLARLFKSAGYRVNAFHMNSGEFYSRNINYQNWGYDNYYSLMDLGTYSGIEYELDRELILNETFYQAMFAEDGLFLNYVITYTPHTPFTTAKGVGKLLAEMNYGDDVPEMTEEECARMQAAETDYMVGLLMQALKDEDLYDNTVIVAFADHYLYTVEDKSILETYKQTENNLINNTPFFIWSSDITPATVEQVTMQTNILPTVLNLFGLAYNSNDYLCEDALAEDYKGFVFFSDGSWYNGRLYVENGEITNNIAIPSNDTTVLSMNKKVGNLIRKNDLTLKYDYFRLRSASEDEKLQDLESSGE